MSSADTICFILKSFLTRLYINEFVPMTREKADKLLEACKLGGLSYFICSTPNKSKLLVNYGVSRCSYIATVASLLNAIILSKAKAIRDHSKVHLEELRLVVVEDDPNLLSELLDVATFIKNRSPTDYDDYLSLLEKWILKRINIDKIPNLNLITDKFSANITYNLRFAGENYESLIEVYGLPEHNKIAKITPHSLFNSNLKDVKPDSEMDTKKKRKRSIIVGISAALLVIILLFPPYEITMNFVVSGSTRGIQNYEISKRYENKLIGNVELERLSDRYETKKINVGNLGLEIMILLIISGTSYYLLVK